MEFRGRFSSGLCYGQWRSLVNTVLCIKQSTVSLASWVGLGTVQDGCREEKISRPHRGSNPQTGQPVASDYTGRAIPAPVFHVRECNFSFVLHVFSLMNAQPCRNMQQEYYPT